MRDPHMNVFHAYRGQSPTEETSVSQLEDNLTRALAITLQHIWSSASGYHLLEALGFADLRPDESLQIQMQVSKTNTTWPSEDKRRLLVIHGGPDLKIIDTSNHTESGRPDIVLSSRSQLLAIESKLNNEVSQQQLNRHIQTLGLTATENRNMTWGDLVRAVAAIPKKERADPMVDFMLHQFEEYLRMNGYGGFSHEHFAYFAHTSEDRDDLVKDGIRRSLGEIGSTIVRETGTHWTVHVLNVMPNTVNCGVIIQPASTKKEPHITVGIDVSGLLIMANIELQHAHSRFIRAWKKDSEGLIWILRTLGNQSIRTSSDSPWRLRVLRRVPLGSPRKYHYWTSADLALNLFCDWNDQRVHDLVESVVQKPAGEAAPEVTITRSYSIPQVLQSNDVGVQLAANTLELQEFFNWIGEPFTPKLRAV